MEFRLLGRSGLKVPVLSFGTGTFGGSNEFFRAWGASDVAEATRLASIFSIRPTSTPTGFRKPFWGRRLRDGATMF